MDTDIDYYKVLGVPSSASRAELKAAWSELVQKLHPDMGESADAKKFMQVQKAFEVLGDEKKRLQYDSARDAASAPRPSQVEEDYVPGWGEPASPAQGASAPTTDRTAEKQGRNRDWVPPHMRTQAAATQQPTPRTSEPPAPPQEEEKAGQRAARPEAHESWRTVADPDITPALVRGWKSLWLVPTAGFALSLVTGLGAIASAGEGMVGTLTPVFVVLVICTGVGGALLDWSRIQSGRESVLGAGIASVVALVLIVLGFGTGNFWLSLTSLLTGFWVGYLGSSLHYKYIVTRQMPAKELTRFAAFGKPGKFAVSNILQLIEQDLADRLGDLFQIPSLRLFHGVSVPARRSEIKGGESFTTKYGAQILPGGYIGQAVTAGKKVAFLTSVTWPGGKYTLDNYGGVMIDGQHTQFDLDAFRSDLKHWKEKLKSKADVRMLVVVHSDGPVTFDMPADLPVELVSVDDVVDTLGCWLVDDQKVLDRQLNATLAEHLAAG